MHVRILYFASLREALGKASEELLLPAGITSAFALRNWLIEEGRVALAQAKNLRMAVNQEMVAADVPLAEGDEIAFFPPVTGG
jgi:molybdopterin synthase sulfur carrier subunit